MQTLDESLLGATIFTALFIFVLLFKIFRKKGKSTKIVEQPEIDAPSIDSVLDNRIQYLSSKFPSRISRFDTRLHHGVTSFRKKRHVITSRKYFFEDLRGINEVDYRNMCGMRLLFGVRQDTQEGLMFIMGNDIPLHYSTDSIMDFFKEEYGFGGDMLEIIRNKIIRYNWRKAGQEYKDILKR
ncbi:MAG: hypothetical protein ACTSQY_03115 [Candidatus Odinarchaeia archaeon]